MRRRLRSRAATREAEQKQESADAQGLRSTAAHEAEQEQESADVQAAAVRGRSAHGADQSVSLPAYSTGPVGAPVGEPPAGSRLTASVSAPSSS